MANSFDKLSDNAYERWAGVKKHIYPLLNREYLQVRVYLEKNGVIVLTEDFYELFLESSESTIQQVMDFVGKYAIQHPITYVGKSNEYIYVKKKNLQTDQFTNNNNKTQCKCQNITR
jgi:hypothetical protein